MKKVFYKYFYDTILGVHPNQCLLSSFFDANLFLEISSRISKLDWLIRWGLEKLVDQMMVAEDAPVKFLSGAEIKYKVHIIFRIN